MSTPKLYECLECGEPCEFFLCSQHKQEEMERFARQRLIKPRRRSKHLTLKDDFL